MKKLMLLSVFLVSAFAMNGSESRARKVEEKFLFAAYHAIFTTAAVHGLNRYISFRCGLPHDNNSIQDAIVEFGAMNAAVYGSTAAIITDDVHPALGGAAVAVTVIAANAAYKKAEQNGYCVIQ